MHPHFNFNGLRVLNTRPKHLAPVTSAKIHREGGHAIELPLVEIQETSSKWQAILPPLHTITHAIFTSAHAVSYFFKHVKNWPHHLNTYAVGKGTKQALLQQGLLTVFLPENADSEHLLLMEPLQAVNQQKVLIIKGRDGRTLIENTLRARHAAIFNVIVYERILPVIAPRILTQLYEKDTFDIILITSETALHHLFLLFDTSLHAWLQNKPCLVISKRLAMVAEKKGFHSVIQSHPDILR